MDTNGTHGEKATTELNVGKIAFVAVVGGLLLVTILYAVQAFYLAEHRRLAERRVVNQPHWELVQLETEQRSKLQDYEWVEPGKTATIPIERAIELEAAAAKRSPR